MKKSKKALNKAIKKAVSKRKKAKKTNKKKNNAFPCDTCKQSQDCLKPCKKLIDTLTPKQKKFCDEYLVDLNATQAAIRGGYSKKSARSKAAQLLTKVNIARYVELSRKKTAKKLEITQETQLDRLEGLIGILYEELTKKRPKKKQINLYGVTRLTSEIRAHIEVENKLLGLNAPEKRLVAETTLEQLRKLENAQRNYFG